MNTTSGTKYRILVVDDEPMVCRAISLLLKFDGHEVQTVSSGEAALALLEHDVFDLIITDFSMEGMKGDQLAAIIKQRWPGHPVIMATAFGPEVSAAAGAAGGVDCVLDKPFTLTQLREAIAWAMSRIALPPAADRSAAVMESASPPLASPLHSGDSGPGRARV